MGELAIEPTGRLDDLEAVATWDVDTGVLVASDECYAEFTWNTGPRTILEYGSGGVLAVHSSSKRSNLAGLRAGFYAGDAAIVSYLRSVRQHAGLMVPDPSRPRWPWRTATMRTSTCSESGTSHGWNCSVEPSRDSTSTRRCPKERLLVVLEGRFGWLGVGDDARRTIGSRGQPWRTLRRRRQRTSCVLPSSNRTSDSNSPRRVSNPRRPNSTMTHE